MKTELFPCPFCGSEANIREFAYGHKGVGEYTASYQCGCKKCGIYFMFDSVFTLEQGKPKFIKNGYDECIKAWNRRAARNEN